MRPTLALYLLLVLAACAVPTPGAVTPKGKNAEIVKGPPMQDIVTDFDRALICMKGKFPERLSFGVGTIADTTGKEQYADSGTGCQRRSKIGPRGGAKLGHFGFVRDACYVRRPVMRAPHLACG